jgi:hypothetical protein
MFDAIRKNPLTVNDFFRFAESGEDRLFGNGVRNSSPPLIALNSALSSNNLMRLPNRRAKAEIPLPAREQRLHRAPRGCFVESLCRHTG